MKHEEIEDFLNKKYIIELLKANLEPKLTKEQEDIIDEIIEELKDSDIHELKIASLFQFLPYEYSDYILNLLSKKQAEIIINYLKSIIYGQFIQETKLLGKATRFENKIRNQTSADIKKYYKTRFITKIELEMLNEVLCEGDEDTPHRPLGIQGSYSGNNTRLKILIKASKKLSTDERFDIHTAVITETLTNHLKVILSLLKKYNNELEK